MFAGFALGAALALVIGAAMGLSRRLDALLDPSFQALRAIPSLAWVPVLLLWMGIDEAPKITLVAIGAFFPIHLSVVAGFAMSTASWSNSAKSIAWAGARCSCASCCPPRCRRSSPACEPA